MGIVQRVLHLLDAVEHEKINHRNVARHISTRIVFELATELLRLRVQLTRFDDTSFCAICRGF